MRFKKRKSKIRFPLIALHIKCDSPTPIRRRPSSGTAAAMRCFGGIAFPLPPPAGVRCKVLFVSATSIRCFLILYANYTTPFSQCQYRRATFRVLSLYCNKFTGIIMHLHHVGASYVSLAPTFLQKSERAHAAAPPLQIEPAALGFDLVIFLRASYVSLAPTYFISQSALTPHLRFFSRSPLCQGCG